MNGRHKTISLAHDRLDEPRMIGVVPECSSQLPYRGVDSGFLIDEYFGAPESGLNLSAFDQAAARCDELCEQLHWEPLNPHPLTAAPQGVRREIEFELREPHPGGHGLRIIRPPFRPCAENVHPPSMASRGGNR